MKGLHDYITGITADKNNQIMLSLKGKDKKRDIVSGFIDSELSFGASATYESLSESSSIDGIAKNFQRASEVMGKSNTMKFPWMTKKSWSGSSVNDFSFSIFKLATKDGENLLSGTAPIWDSVLPGSAGGQTLDSFTTPNGYISHGKGGTSNSVTLKIGNWYESNGWLMVSANLTVSKEKIDEGKTLPLYIKIDVTLSRDMDITSSQFKQSLGM